MSASLIEGRKFLIAQLVEQRKKLKTFPIFLNINNIYNGSRCNYCKNTAHT